MTLANLSYKLGRSVRFDPKSEKIIGDEEASRMLNRTMREPWRL